MSAETEKLLAEVLLLSHEEQDEFVTRLIDTLDAPTSAIDDMTEEQFAQELMRRAEELRTNPGDGLPWEQVREMR